VSHIYVCLSFCNKHSTTASSGLICCASVSCTDWIFDMDTEQSRSLNCGTFGYKVFVRVEEVDDCNDNTFLAYTLLGYVLSVTCIATLDSGGHRDSDTYNHIGNRMNEWNGT
jgi:hypothetical protein